MFDLKNNKKISDIKTTWDSSSEVAIDIEKRQILALDNNTKEIILIEFDNLWSTIIKRSALFQISKGKYYSTPRFDGNYIYFYAEPSFVVSSRS